MQGTHVVLSHVGKEGGEDLSKVAAEDGGDGADEVASRADESSVVLGLLSKGLGSLGLLLIVKLARSLAPEDLVEVVAEGLDVWKGDSKSALVLSKSREDGTYRQGR